MAILDIFKKKNKEEKEVDSKEEKVTQEKKPQAEPRKKEIVRKEDVKIAGSRSAYGVLKSPHVTEKAMNLGAENKYIFKVSSAANKVEVRKAVQSLYNVKVENVNIINIPRKKRRLGRSEGFKSGYKKAIVKLREGDKIDAGV